MRLPFHRDTPAAPATAGVRVCALAELPVGGMHRTPTRPAVTVIRHSDHLHALEDRCPHAGASLARGTLDGDRLTCPVHQAVFDVGTGRSLGPLACRDLRTYRVWTDGRDVYLDPQPRAARTARKAPCPQPDPTPASD